MLISKIGARNFRLLHSSDLDFGQSLCMMIGRNNSGKTSFMVLMDKFYNSIKFNYEDFSLSIREKIDNFNKDTNIHNLSIKLLVEIAYDENDNLCNLCEFIQDLDPSNSKVKILFECTIKKEELLSAINQNKEMSQERFIRKYLSDFLITRIYIYEDESDFHDENRFKLIPKELKAIKKLLDFDIIHAKRSVTSSEEKSNKKVLSTLTTAFYNNNNINSPDKFEAINTMIVEMDNQLNNSYEVFFEGFLSTSKRFLNIDNLRIVSNLRASEIVNNSSEVIYGDDKNNLPEYLNGLGYMNILYLLLSIEIRKSIFNVNNKDIKLLYIEEPEAHTHPQLQCIFARKISEILSEINGLQTIISTHSPHIVSNVNFECIRYLLVSKTEENYYNVTIKNFHNDLKLKYADINEFQFIKQYLTIEAAELFFASKIIFIEGTSENMLMPLFISNYDKEEMKQEELLLSKGAIPELTYRPITTQNISILQVGANAKAFRHFVEFLDIKTLVITDIDTVKYSGKPKRLHACAVNDSPDSTSNETIKYYLAAPDPKSKDKSYEKWLANIIAGKSVSISNKVGLFYQVEDNGYHPRSFEDAFISINFDLINANKSSILGLINTEDLEKISDYYLLTEKILNKKSDFASSLLYLAHTKGIEWQTPKYIKEGLKWIQE